MASLRVDHRVFKLNDFMGWQRQGSLRLSPSFQRRPVWDKGAKSYLLDTVLRGLPVPVVFIRERLDIDTQKTIREVVDGQQRLRTLFGFVDPDLLPDFDNRDDFTIQKKHNPGLAGKTYAKLDSAAKTDLLEYEFSVNVFPSSVEDRDLLQIFARLNSTGYRLTAQELRNAEYFGSFKTAMYELALEQLDRWRDWRLFNEQDIARMSEVELTSDLCITIMDGLYGKSKKKIDDKYRLLDERFDEADEVAKRFRATMDTIDDIIGRDVASSVYQREVFFYSLFALTYHEMWGLGSSLHRRKARQFDRDRLRRAVRLVGVRFEKRQVPEEFEDAVDRATSDLGRRTSRHNYLLEVLAES